MNISSDTKVVIVGAGIAGLTLALLLVGQGLKPVVIEREQSVGGLARSFIYDGFTFDVGPHRFHTDNPKVDRFVREVLGDDLIEIERRSGVWMAGEYLEWPLDFSATFKLPFGLLCASVLEMFKKRKCLDDSFESYIISRYGRPLYEVFFKPYTEKFLGITCDRISRDWAVTGIDRAVIDSSIRVDTLTSLALSTFRKEPSQMFIYPRSGGIDVFSKRLAGMIESAGGKILRSETVEQVSVSRGRVTGVTLKSGEALRCNLLFWTAPLTALQKVMRIPCHDLDYLSMLIYNYRVRESVRLPYQWCYFGAADIPFNRVSIPSNFNPLLSPPGQCGVCVEVTCHAGDVRMECPEQADPFIRKALVDNGIIGSLSNIEGIGIERVREAYPMYTLGYQGIRNAALQELSQFANLHILGRSGRFWYNNMDNSIEDAMRVAEQFDVVAV